MRKSFFTVFVLFVCAVFSGCGYSVRSSSLGSIRTIHIEPFKNKINYGTETVRGLYVPLMEVKLTNAVVDRYLFDGNLRVIDKEKADLILQGELTNFQRDALRYTDNNDVEEYRLTMTVSMTLWDNVQQKPRWSESGFSGDTTYFVTGPLAKSESLAIEDALKDIARRIVERTIEDW